MTVPIGTLERHRFRLLFALIILAAGLLRVGYVVLAKDGDPLVGDQIYYSGQAVKIADGGWFADPYRPGRYAADHVPLTALAVAPVSWSDTSVTYQRLAMAGYGTLVVAGLGLLARRLLGRRIALLATVIAAGYANLWMNDALVMAETLAAGTVVLALLSAYRYERQPSPVVAAAAGAAVGIAGLARAELLLLGPAVIAPMILFAGRRTEPAATEPRSMKVRLIHLTVAGAAAILVIAPWVIRNQIRFEESTWMSTQDGLTLLGANCPAAYEGDGIGFWILQCADRIELPPDTDQSEVSAIYREAAIDFIGDHADRLPAVVAARLGRGLSVWRPEAMIDLNIGEGREPWASRIGMWQYWALAPLAVVGLWSWRGAQARWPLLATAGLSVLLIIGAYGIPRFRIAAEVVIVVGAAAGIDSLSRRVTARRVRLGTVRSPAPPTTAT